MIPPSSQSSPPQQQQQADSSSTLQSSTLPQTQTGAQQLQVTFCSFISLFLWPYCSINFLLSIFMLAFFLKIVYFLWIHNSHYRGCSFFFPSTLPFCMLHIPAWLLVLGQWSKSSYLVSSTQRRASILPLSGLVPLCSAGTLQKTNQMCVGACMWVRCKAFGLHFLIRFLFLTICVHLYLKKYLKGAHFVYFYRFYLINKHNRFCNFYSKF